MTGLIAGVTPLAVVVAATVAVWHGSIDSQSYIGLIAAVLGLGAGAGIHAAGVKSGGGSGAGAP